MKEIHIPLPDTLHGLLTVALEDLETQVARGVKPNMFVWLSTTDLDDPKECSACLAGAVMLQRVPTERLKLFDRDEGINNNFGISPNSHSEDDRQTFHDETSRRLRALEPLRKAQLTRAYWTVHGSYKITREIRETLEAITNKHVPLPDPPNGDPRYSSVTTIWLAAMRSLRDDLKEAGL